ncbi:MAG: prolipoprotein diacylglyceryl transferase [Chloroflexi bacterium]|nr:prolipoprotein diacylglyceryl transferase [Chloroflexota bacterium]MDA1148096.1 prolipoprotein diacylglyceryl transferase [Chloroflexota bacterium]
MTPLLVIEIPWGPNITTVAGFLLTWHGLFTAVGILVGVQVALRIGRATGVDEDDMYTLALVAVPAGIVGARGLYVIENWDFFGSNLGQIIAITEGGISVWGSLITGVLGAAAFAVWRGYQVRPTLDAAAFGMILGLGIGRLGDLINGEHLSRPTDLPWGVVYTSPDSPAFAHSIAVGAHHPATSYEMILGGLIFAALFPLFFRWLYRYPGVTFMVTAAAYALVRFMLTYLRVDSADLALGIRVPQIVSILTWLIVIPLAIYWLRQGADEDRPVPHVPGRIPIARPEPSARR